jgi:hypothetical protein
MTLRFSLVGGVKTLLLENNIQVATNAAFQWQTTTAFPAVFWPSVVTTSVQAPVILDAMFSSARLEVTTAGLLIFTLQAPMTIGLTSGPIATSISYF